MTACALEVAGHSGDHKIRTVQVVVQPWQGRLQVYWGLRDSRGL
jgi:hypothetical protein